MRGDEGAVGVAFRVAADGRVGSVAITRSSGSTALDAAVHELLDGKRVPPFPPEMAAAERDVALTIRFRIEN